MANARAEWFTSNAGDVGEEPIMCARSDAQPAVTGRQQLLEAILGRLRPLTGQDYAKSVFAYCTDW